MGFFIPTSLTTVARIFFACRQNRQAPSNQVPLRANHPATPQEKKFETGSRTRPETVGRASLKSGNRPVREIPAVCVQNLSKFQTVNLGENAFINDFALCRPGMEDAEAIGVSVNGIKVADWAEAEFLKKIRVERRVYFCFQARGIFVLLLFAAIFVFVFNHQVQVQSIAAAELQQVTKRPTASDKIREHALKHEKEVEQINE